MSDGIEHDDPHHAKYCEVIQIGIEDDTAEVTIFYTPEKGELAFIYSCFLYNGSSNETADKSWSFFCIFRISSLQRICVWK